MADRLGLNCVAEGVETSYRAGSSCSADAPRPKAISSAPLFPLKTSKR